MLWYNVHLVYHQKRGMASLEDLKNVLKETLDNRGVLNQLRARIRAEVFSALDDQTETKPILSNENLLINELIREYLEFNSYKYTTTVLLAESGQPKDPVDRQFLATELNLTETASSRQVPILYGLLSHCLEQRNERDVPERDIDSRVPPPPPRANVQPANNAVVPQDPHEGTGYLPAKGMVYHKK